MKKQIIDINNDVENILFFIQEEKRKKTISGLLYEIIFLFNYYYQRDKFLEMMKNKNINTILFDFLSTKKDIFRNLYFNKPKRSKKM